MKCPHCGAALEITDELERFACSYCGAQQLVQRTGGIVALKLVGDAISRVQQGTDRTAAELAVRRLREDLEAYKVKKIQLLNDLRAIHLHSGAIAAHSSVESRIPAGCSVGCLALLATFWAGICVAGVGLARDSSNDRTFGIGLMTAGFVFASILFAKIFTVIWNKKNSARLNGDQRAEEDAVGMALARNAEQMRSTQLELEHHLKLLGSNRIG